MVPIDASKVPMAASTPLPAENLSAGRGPNNTGVSGGELSPQLRRDGFNLHQLERVGGVALYQKTKGNYTGWEIILIRNRPGRHLPNGKYISACECYPASAEWGIRGWTAMSFTTAKRRFNNLVKRYAESI
mgnify:CR=1 FL=1